MNRKLIKFKYGAASILFVASLAGCGTVVRENIIASVDTGLGVTLAENPKTEMYEAKLGFIRNQFYSVPTGKIVKNEKEKFKSDANEGDARTNQADLTPEVVSGIRVSTSAKHLFLGADVSENFAVGKIAVMSPAAVAMYIANADTDAKASAAALTAAQSVTAAPANMNSMLPLAHAYTDFSGNADKQAVFNKATKDGTSGNFSDFPSFISGNPTPEQIAAVRAELEKDPEIKSHIK